MEYCVNDIISLKRVGEKTARIELGGGLHVRTHVSVDFGYDADRGEYP